MLYSDTYNVHVYLPMNTMNNTWPCKTNLFSITSYFSGTCRHRFHDIRRWTATFLTCIFLNKMVFWVSWCHSEKRWVSYNNKKRGAGQCATNKISIGQDILLKIFTCITNCLNQSCGRTDIYTEWSQNYT